MAFILFQYDTVRVDAIPCDSICRCACGLFFRRQFDATAASRVSTGHKVANRYEAPPRVDPIPRPHPLCILIHTTHRCTQHTAAYGSPPSCLPLSCRVPRCPVRFLRHPVIVFRRSAELSQSHRCEELYHRSVPRAVSLSCRAIREINNWIMDIRRL